MAVIYKKQVDEDTVLAVWKIVESKTELLNFLGENFYDTHSKHDNIHWLASRALVKHLFAGEEISISKNEFNKPFVKINDLSYHISITHSFDYAAVIISRSRIVGIDMEKFDKRIDRVKHKFVREDESYLTGEDNESEMLTVLWSAKETLYKYYGNKELDFLKHLKIEQFEVESKFVLKGSIKKNDYFTELDVQVEKLDGYVLTYLA